jgi:ketosteroid isomerase-like protein
MSDNDVAAVLAAEERRCAAVAAEDWAALDEVVGDDFEYTHSTGKRENKAQWLAGIQTRRRAIEHEDLTVRLFGDVALVSGSSVNHYAEPFIGDSHYGSILDVLLVFVKRDGDWQIVAQHGVKNAEKN